MQPLDSSAASLFYAFLQHSSGAWYGCYLKWTDSNTLRCGGSENLLAGLWGVQVFVYRQPGAKFIQMRLTDPSQVYGEGLLAFLEKVKVDHFNEWKEYFDYNVSSVGCALIGIQESGGRRPSKPVKQEGTDLDTTGTWSPLLKDRPNEDAWEGVPQEVLDSASDRSRDMEHFFCPFNGKTFRHFSQAEMRSCMMDHQLVFIGDSRTKQLYNLARYLVNGSDASTYPLVIETNKVPNFGLASLLKDPQMSTLQQYIAQGDTILLNSLLHDLADFAHKSLKVEDVHKYWDPALCKNCKAGSTPRACGCSKKPYPVQSFISNLLLVRSLIEEAIANRTSRGLPAPRVYWLSIPKRPPIVDSLVYPWQTPDVIDYLYDMSVKILSNYSHVDLRPHMQTAPAHWWDDNVHWGGFYHVDGRKKWAPSMFQYTSLQVIMNHVCS